MSVTSDYLHRVIERLSDDVRAEIVDGDIILKIKTPASRDALALRELRQGVGRAAGLIALERTTVALPATEDEFIPDLAYYSFEDLDPDVWLVQVPYGAPLPLPAPFNLTLDTSIFNS